MIKAVTLDLDGTVYFGQSAVEGAADFIAFMRSHNIKLMFVTNRANRLPEEIATHLKEMGIACSTEEILTSSQATADYLEPAPTYIIGETGLETILRGKGFTLRESDVKYVIVSFDRFFTYDKLKKACNLIHRGAEFIATNPDQGLPTEDGIQPGTGSIVAAVQACCGVKPVYIGKPEPLILETAASQMAVSPSETLAIGDNIATDVPSGSRAGMKTALILTGISSRKDIDGSDIKPDITADDYSDLKSQLLSLIES